MFHDLRPLLGTQGIEWFGQQFVRQAKLADVMQQAGQHDVLCFAIAQAQALGYCSRQFSDPSTMPGELVAARSAAQFNQTGKDLNGGQERFFQLAMRLLDKGQRLLQLGSSLGNLSLKAGIQNFEFFVLGLSQRCETAIFSFQTLPVQRFADCIDDLLVIPGFGDVTVNFTFIDGRDRRGDIRVAGEQDAHGRWPALADLLEKGSAVHFRHAHVGNDQIDRFLFELGQPGSTTFGDENAIAMRPEEAAQGRKNARLVIDEEQGGGFGHFAHCEVSGKVVADSAANGWMGMMTRNEVPMPSWLLTSMRPWWVLMMP